MAWFGYSCHSVKKCLYLWSNQLHSSYCACFGNISDLMCHILYQVTVFVLCFLCSCNFYNFIFAEGCFGIFPVNICFMFYIWFEVQQCPLSMAFTLWHKLQHICPCRWLYFTGRYSVLKYRFFGLINWKWTEACWLMCFCSSSWWLIQGGVAVNPSSSSGSNGGGVRGRSLLHFSSLSSPSLLLHVM